MSPDRFRRMDALYDAAAGMDPDARARYLEEQCAGDEPLRREMLAMFTDKTAGLLTHVVVQAANSMAGQTPALEPETLPGTTLDHKYRIGKELGRGAMGAVFQAVHIGTTRPVAIKVVAPTLAINPEFVQRFKREAETAGRLTHPNVVNVTDFGVARAHHGDLAYLVMEYLDGQTLAAYLKDTPRPAYPFLFDVIDQTALALDAAHAAGIVHRDLKPSNIWLQPDLRGGFHVKVLDFGLAKVVVTHGPAAAGTYETLANQMAIDESTGTPTLLAKPSHVNTTVGALMGTPTYMAPEQCSGLKVDHRADIYGLAVLAYQMLCGRPPFHGETLIQLIQQQIQTAPPSPKTYDAAVPEPLANVVLSALEKDPAKRPQSAGIFAHQLRAASEGEIGLIHRSKDVFQTHLNPFLPVMTLCVAAAMAGLVPLQLALRWALNAHRLPEGAALSLLMCGSCLSILSSFQLFKAACMLILRYASAAGSFENLQGPVLRTLATGCGTLLRTQLRSMLDLRLSSWRASLLWPVVWAAEGRSGRGAIARSRQLSKSVPWATAGLLARQYGPALLGPMMLPAMLAVMDPPGGALLFFEREVLAGTLFGWLMTLYVAVAAMFFVNYGPAFCYLYWSALRCRNESVEAKLPQAVRKDSGKSAARAVHPATLAWWLLPLSLLLITIPQFKTSDVRQAVMAASDEGRRSSLVRLLDQGFSPSSPVWNGESALFEAVRTGDEVLVAELLKRGASASASRRDGATPLMMAAIYGRNQLARVLLSHGAAVNAANQTRRTALMIAAMRGNAELVRLLLDSGADRNLKDKKGKTAADYAFEEGYPDLASMMQPQC